VGDDLAGDLDQPFSHLLLLRPLAAPRQYTEKPDGLTGTDGRGTAKQDDVTVSYCMIDRGGIACRD